MSDNSDDDIWARVRKEADAKATETSDNLRDPEIALEPSQRAHGSIAKHRSSEAAATKMAWETTEEEADGPPLPSKRRKRSKPPPTILIGSIIVALLWVLGAGLFLMQNATTFGADGSTLLFSLVVLLLGPAFSLLAGFMGESVAKSNREARILMSAARRMLEPDTTGDKAVRSTAHAVRTEIERLENTIGHVADRLLQIEGNVETQTSALSAAGNTARGSADHLVATMQDERGRLDALLAAMAELTTQAQNSTHLASQTIEERALQMAQAADSLVDKSTEASNVAAGAAQNLNVAALRALDAIQQLDQAAVRGETALARAHDLMVLARVRADEAVGNVGQAVSALHDAAASASETARVVSETIQGETAAGRDANLATVDEIRATAMANALAVTNALNQEAEAARVAGAQTLAALQASAEAVRFAAEEARQQSNQQMADNQRGLDVVRQSAFDVGKEADAFMQTRIIDARALIEHSAGLLDETGNKIQERFGKLAAACADQARAVEDLLDGLDRRLESLPQEADARAKAIETALNETLMRLTDAGRKAADETSSLDAAFQERLRDSYSALGEVVQRLGGLSGVLAPMQQSNTSPMAPAETAIQVAQPKLPEPPVPQTTAPQPTVPAAAPTLQPTASITLSGAPLNQTPPRPKPTPQHPNSAPQDQVRANDQIVAVSPRLNISSPMAIEDDPFSELQIGRTQPVSPDAETGWSWKQVLSTLDAKGVKAETGRIAELLTELDLIAALTDGALEKLIAMAGRSRDEARRSTRELVPNEVRAMRRKLTSDPDLRASIVRFVEARREAAARGRLVGNEARVYFVADAALEA